MDAKDKMELRLLIVNTVRTTLRESNEKWLSKEQLMEQFQMFTPSWMKTYGDLLPCSHATVVDSNGIAHDSRKAYPMYKIQEMIQSGAIKDLEMNIRLTKITKEMRMKMALKPRAKKEETNKLGEPADTKSINQ